MKLNKGYTYLVRITKYTGGYTFWILQQDSQKGWSAVRFTHLKGSYEDITLIQGNSLVVVEKLQEMSKDRELDYRAVNSNSELRKEMFNILQKGEFIS